MRPLLALFVLAAPLARVSAADPLSRLPPGYTLAVSVPDARAAADAVRGLPAVASATGLAEVREALTTGPARRFADLVGYYERELGADWPTLLGKLAGRGLAVGAMFGQDDGPAVVVAEGTDADAAGDFFRLAVKLIEAEAGGQLLRHGTHAGAAVVHNGKDFFAARRDSTLYLSNREDACFAALDHTGKSLLDAAAPGRALVGGDPLAWLWVDTHPTRRTKATADFLENSRKDFLGVLAVGATVDAIRRADCVAAGLHRTAGGLALEVKLPAKRADLPPGYSLHVPPAGPGSLPLLRPPGTLYSQSIYLDLGSLWRERKALLVGDQLRDVEKAERDISKFLPNTTLGTLLEQSGPHHRLVVADVPGDPYGTKPGVPYPAAAAVLSMRDPAFGKAMGSALRAGALAVTGRYKLKMRTEEHDGVKLVTYRFPEGVADDADPDNERFNMVPCFAVVDSYLVVATRPELVKALLPELRGPAGAGSAAVWRGRLDAAGAAGFLRRHPEPVVSRGLLTQGLGLAEARARAAEGIDWLAALGGAELSLDHRADCFAAKIEWTQR